MTSKRLLRSGVVFLAGPAIWYLFFWVVYLIAEAGCTAGSGDFRVFGLDGVVVATLGLTALAAVLTVVYAGRARRELAAYDTGLGDVLDWRRALVYAGGLLAGLFLIATLFVGLPVVVLRPC